MGFRARGGNGSSQEESVPAQTERELPLSPRPVEPIRDVAERGALRLAAAGRRAGDRLVEAAERELHYLRLVGHSPSDTARLDLALTLGPRPARGDAVESRAWPER